MSSPYHARCVGRSVFEDLNSRLVGGPALPRLREGGRKRKQENRGGPVGPLIKSCPRGGWGWQLLIWFSGLHVNFAFWQLCVQKKAVPSNASRRRHEPRRAAAASPGLVAQDGPWRSPPWYGREEGRQARPVHEERYEEDEVEADRCEHGDARSVHRKRRHGRSTAARCCRRWGSTRVA